MTAEATKIHPGALAPIGNQLLIALLMLFADFE
jgi:hypothetical protein